MEMVNQIKRNMNEYEVFYANLDHNIWKEFEEKLEYRISRAINEPVEDEEWFLMCGLKDLVTAARKAVLLELKKNVKMQK